MRRIIFCFLCLSISCTLFSQYKVTNYFFTGWNMMTADNGSEFYALANVALVSFDKQTGDSRIISYPDGLKSSSMVCLKMDNAGTIWVGTENGLFSYDGSNWQRYTFTDDNGDPANRIDKIFVDSKNRKWISFARYLGNNRMALIDGQNKTIYDSAFSLPYAYFTDFVEDKNGDVWSCGRINSDIPFVFKFTKDTVITWSPSPDLSQALYTIALDSTGNIWTGAPSGAAWFNGTKWSTIKYNKYSSQLNVGVYRIEVDKTGLVWFVGSGGACHYDGKEWGNLWGSDGLNYVSGVSDILPLDNGDIWFVCDSNVTLYSKGKCRNYTVADGLPANHCFNISRGLSGEIFVSSYSGAAMYDGSKWRKYKVKNSIIYNNFSSLCCDSKDHLWAIYSQTPDDSSYSRLCMFDGVNWKNFKKSEVPGIDFGGIQCDNKGQLWIGGYGGIAKYDGNSWQSYSIGDSLDSRRTYGRFTIDSSGKLWIATRFDSLWTIYQGIPIYGIYRGFFSFNNSKWTAIHHELDTNRFERLNVIGSLKNGNIVGITGNNFLRTLYDNGSWSSVDLKQLITDTLWNSPNNIAIDKNSNIWCSIPYIYNNGTRNGCLLKYDGTNATLFQGRDGIPSHSFYGFTFTDVNDVCADISGNIWVGTNDGLGKFNGLTWDTIDTRYDLSYNTINFVTLDSKGNIWCATDNRGLSFIRTGTVDVRDYKTELNLNNNISISPNPAGDYTTISVGANGCSPVDIKFFDVFGQEYLTPTLSTSGEGVRIDVSSLSPGVYFVRKGNKVRKFVKI